MSWQDKELKRNNQNQIVPQHYDPQADDWDVVEKLQEVKDEDVKAEIESLKAEVVAIKEGTSDVSDSEAQTRLQAIEDKLDSVLKTEVTGSNVLIKELTDSWFANITGSSPITRYHGETSAISDPNALDVSAKPYKAVYIENNYNADITNIKVFGYEKDGSISDSLGEELAYISKLEPGEKFFFTPYDYPKLTKPYKAINIRFTGMRNDITEGGTVVRFYGIDNVKRGDIAYNNEQDRYKTEVERAPSIEAAIGSLVDKYQGSTVETFFEGEVEPGETTSVINVPYYGENEMWYLVNTDKGNWRLSSQVGPWNSIRSTNTVYPSTNEVTSAYVNAHLPFQGLAIYRTNPLVTIEDMEKAMLYRQRNPLTFNFTNNNEETANVTIKIMRVFRG